MLLCACIASWVFIVCGVIISALAVCVFLLQHGQPATDLAAGLAIAMVGLALRRVSRRAAFGAPA
jgi:uncharacterized membrane protein